MSSVNPIERPSHFYPDGTAWYCLRAKNKAEHIAAAQLRQLEGVSSFSPRIRFPKATARGKVLFQQALFPGYVFARFDFATQCRLVSYSLGVTGMVRFGDDCPPVPRSHIEYLQQEMGPEELRTVEMTLEEGDAVEIAQGPFRGFEAVIHTYMPAKDRVKVLLEILGNQRLVEVSQDDLVGLGYRPLRL